MIKSRSLAIIFCLLILQWSSTTILAADVERLQWKPVPGATFYVGTIGSNGATFRIKTPSTWILIEAGSVKKIDAWNASGPLQTNIPIERSPTAMQQSGAPEPISEPSVAPSPEIEPLPTPETEDEPTPEVEPSPEPSSDLDQAEPDTQPLQEDNTKDVTEAEETESVDEQMTYSLHSRAGVSIGMGRQWVKSEVGISDFKGGANIGGTILSGSIVNAASPIWYGGEFSAHNFTTETSKSTSTSDSKAEEKNTQMRIRISGFYNFFQQVSSPLTGVSVGAGIQYLKHPLLVIENKLTAAATMKTESVLSLNLGGRYSTLLSPKNLFAAGIDIAPYSFGKDVKTMSSSAFTEWLHLITPRIYTNLGLNLGRERLTTSNKCPAVTNCKEQGLTNSDILQIRMGLAVGF